MKKQPVIMNATAKASRSFLLLFGFFVIGSQWCSETSFLIDAADSFRGTSASVDDGSEVAEDAPREHGPELAEDILQKNDYDLSGWWSNPSSNFPDPTEDAERTVTCGPVDESREGDPYVTPRNPPRSDHHLPVHPMAEATPDKILNVDESDNENLSFGQSIFGDDDGDDEHPLFGQSILDGDVVDDVIAGSDSESEEGSFDSESEEESKDMSKVAAKLPTGVKVEFGVVRGGYFWSWPHFDVEIRHLSLWSFFRDIFMTFEHHWQVKKQNIIDEWSSEDPWLSVKNALDLDKSEEKYRVFHGTHGDYHQGNIVKLKHSKKEHGACWAHFMKAFDTEKDVIRVRFEHQH